MKLLKNFLFVSYIKNKGVRRICFVLGLLFCLLPINAFILNFEYHFHTKTYANITLVEDYNKLELEYIYKHYPTSIQQSGVDMTFGRWRDFFISNYGQGRKDRLIMSNQCYILEHGKRKELNKIWQDNESFSKLKNFCQELERYTAQEITVHIHDYSYLVNIIYIILYFYLPFLICCIFRWIYMGFREDRN